MSNLKIVIAGSFNGLTTEFGLSNGFKKLGWQVRQVNSDDYSGHFSGRYKRIIARLKLPFTINKYNAAILETVNVIKPQFFLTVKGSYITTETLVHIRKLGIFTINYFPDFHFNHPGIRESDFVYFDRFFTTKSFQVQYLVKKLGTDRVTFLHHGYVSGFHEPPLNPILANEGADIVYIGSHSTEKERWLRHVKKRFPNANFKIYGNRWTTVQDKEIFGDSITGVPLYGQDYAKAIYTAKINLAIHMGSAGDHSWADLVSTRTFEIPACKGFMLHVDNHEIRQLFTPEVEIDVFLDMDQLCEKIGFYLTHDEVRCKMLESAYRRCVPDYSYDERARSIADSLCSNA